jgi:hypothetical protein
MWPKGWAGSYLALVPSSTCMPRQTHRGWLEDYPIIHPWSKVRYRLTHRPMKLFSLGIPYVPYASVNFKCLFIRTKPTWALINTDGGYHLGAPNFMIQTTFNLPIQYSSLSPNCPARSPIMPSGIIILLNHIGPPSLENDPIVSGFQPLVFYR